MSFENLDDSNVVLYAIKAYDKPNLIMSEFEEDFKRLSYLQKLFFRYHERNDLKERLILNHIIVLYNVFGIEPAVRLMFLKLDSQYYNTLATFLDFLQIMPRHVDGIDGTTIHSIDLRLDFDVLTALKRV